MKIEAETINPKKIPADNNLYCERNPDLEDVEKRSLFSKEFDCHNRARKKILFGSPVHFFNNETNRYENINLSLKNSDEFVINDTNSFKTTFNKNTKSNSVFEITKDDYAISLKLKVKDETKNEEKALSKQVEENSKFVIKENDDIEYNYKVLNNKVKDEIVINKKQDNYKYDFIIEVKNLDVQLADNGNINLVDNKTGQIKFFIPKPFMIDADDLKSNDIDCVINKNGDSSYSLSLLPNSEWINDNNRSFPVIIDPEIVEYEENIPFTINTYQKTNAYYSSGSGSYWGLIPDQIFYLGSDYHLKIILDISHINIPINKICSLWLNLGYYGEGIIYINGVEYYYSQNNRLNLTSLINGHFDFCFDIDFAESTCLTGMTRTQPYMYINFEIEYILDNYGDTKKIISLSNRFDSIVDIADGDLMINMPDTIVETGNLKLPIHHNYKVNDANYGCGKSFMLNLHQKVKQVNNNFFYLNSDGEYEKIEEKFYYIDEEFKRHYVEKNQIVLDQNQQLIVSDGNATYKVYRKQVTESGLSFSSRLESVSGIKYIDQRADEEKEIQDYLDDCISALKSLKLFNYDTNTMLNCPIVIRYDYDNFSDFLGNIALHIVVMNESSILQYLSLSQQIEMLRNENGSNDQIQLLYSQLDYIVNTAKNQKSQIERIYSNYLAKRKEYLELKRIIPQWILDNGLTKYGFNCYGNLCAVFNNLGDYISVIWKSIDVQNVQIDIISEVVGNDVSAIFEYDYGGKLLSINNSGKIIIYNYSSDKLEGIFYPNGEFVRFSYEPTNLLSSLSTSDQKIYDFSYDSLARVNLIKSSSFVGTLDSSTTLVLEESSNYSDLTKYQISNVSIDYQTGKTIICENDNYSYYYFDDSRHIYMSYSLNNGIYNDLTLSYVENESCSITILPKKSWQRVDNISSMSFELESSLANINISSNSMPNISSLTNGQYPNFGEANYVISNLDDFNRAKSETTNWQKIGINKYTKTETEYFYGALNYLNPCIKKATKHYEASNPSNSETIDVSFEEIEEYEYEGNGRLARTKRYVLGEELTNGISISEYEYDEKDNQIVGCTYNSLDASNKFYDEKAYSKKGLLKQIKDETGENSTIYSFDSTNKTIVESNPSSKIGYGYDQLSRLVSISQSTETGERNAVNRIYNLDKAMSFLDSNNSIDFSYDKKGRVKSIDYNGVISTFNYYGSKYDEVENISETSEYINNIQFYGYQADKIVANSNGVAREMNFDKRGKIFKIKENNIEKYRANYNNNLLQIESISGVLNDKYFVSYSYDSFNRPISIITQFNNNENLLTENYLYKDNGLVDEASYCINEITYAYKYNYSFDSRHIINEIVVFGNYHVFPSLDVSNRYSGKTINNNNGDVLQKYKIIYRQIGDHSTNMPSSVYYDSFTNGVKSSSTSLKYKYDASNNITEIREDDVLINKYQYDSLNRLIREDNKKLNRSFFFNYDNNGNLLSKKETNYTLTKKDEISSFDNSFDYLYDGDKMISFDDESIAYDQYNRPINYRGQSAMWDNNRLIQFGNNSFVYDGLGRRISKNSIFYIYDSNGRLISQKDNDDVIVFAYDYSGLVGFRYNNEDYIYRKNIQGDIVSIYKVSNNSLEASYVYDAWGNHIVLNSNGNEITNHSHIGFINPFRYRSYYYDNETGLYYLKSRYYDPRICRFISIDSLDSLNPEKVNGLNLWIYCYDNPIHFADNNGRIATPTVLLFYIIGIAISTGVANSIAASEQIVAHGFNPFNWDWARFGLAALDAFAALSTVFAAIAVAAYTDNIQLGLGTFVGLNQLINATYFNFFASSNSSIANNSYNYGYLTRWERLDYTKTQLGSDSIYGFWARQFYGEYSLHMYGYFLFPYIKSFEKADVKPYLFDYDHGTIVSFGINIFAYLFGLFGF